MKTGLPVSAQVVEEMKYVIQDFRRSRKDSSTDGKEPAISADVERIIQLSPEGIMTTVAEVSLWLTSPKSGARAITSFKVLLGDNLSSLRPCCCQSLPI